MERTAPPRPPKPTVRRPDPRAAARTTAQMLARRPTWHGPRCPHCGDPLPFEQSCACRDNGGE